MYAASTQHTVWNNVNIILFFGVKFDFPHLMYKLFEVIRSAQTYSTFKKNPSNVNIFRFSWCPIILN